jgi:hypothetical protein
VACNKDYRQGVLRLGEDLLQLQTAWSRHLQVEHHFLGSAAILLDNVTEPEYLLLTQGQHTVFALCPKVQ